MQKTDAFESHAITVIAPIKLQIVVIYYPPGQIIAPFLEELDGLLSSFMEDGTPILVFGDFNIHLDKPYVPSLRRKYPKFSPLQPSYNMFSRPNPLTPSPSNLSFTLTALTHIINTSLPTGIFPTAFKQARVTPLLKKPTLNTSLLEKYRPVSLLPFIAKTLEWVVFKQVSLFLSQNNKLDTKQPGFRSGHSTETALLSVTEALRTAKADSKSSVLILLDLSAAIDTVNHQILLSTVSWLDITGIPLRWFE